MKCDTIKGESHIQMSEVQQLKHGLLMISASRKKKNVSHPFLFKLVFDTITFKSRGSEDSNGIKKRKIVRACKNNKIHCCKSESKSFTRKECDKKQGHKNQT